MSCSHSAEARSLCYGFLADIYNLLPNADFLAMVADIDARGVFKEAVRGAPAVTEEHANLDAGVETVERFQRQLQDANQDELLVRLGVDRTRLFRGVRRDYGPPPPYESLYRGGNVLMGEPAISTKRFYAECGYNRPEDGNEPPDYIGLELDFMRFLCQEEAKAWAVPSETRAVQCQASQTEFLRTHMVAWIPAFCGEMLAHATEDFYRGIALLTRALVILDAAGLQGPDA